MKRFLLPALIVCFLLPAVATRADYSATASIDWSSFNVQLIDLSDGINAPAFNWTPATAYGNVYSDAYTVYPDDFMSDSQSAPDFTTLLSTNTSTAEAQSSTLRSSTSLFGSAAAQSGSNPWGVFNNYSYASAENGGVFGLSGQGIALISFDWQISVAGAVGDYDNSGSAGVYMYADYTSGLNQFGYAGNGFDVASFNVGTGDHSGTLSMVIYNSGNGTTTGDMYVGLNAQASSVSVPEPASLALMLVGLGFVGLVARRRFK